MAGVVAGSSHDAEHTVTATFQYVSLGRKLAETSDAPYFTLAREYRPRTPVAQARAYTTVTVGSSYASLTHSFDELGRISSIALYGLPLAQYQYANGALDHIDLGKGTGQSVQYDDHG